MHNRLTEDQRKVMDEGHALVVHCAACNSEFFLAQLPISVDDLVKLGGGFKCPSDKSHTIRMGALPLTSHDDKAAP